MQDITPATAAVVIEQLSAYKGIPCALSLFSDGGHALGALAVARYITNPENRMDVEGRAYGNVASGAMLIMQACQRRLVTRGAFSQIHDAYPTGDGDPDENMKAQIADFNAKQVELYAKRSGKRPEAIRKLMSEDRPLSSDEAIRLGFYDGEIPQSLGIAALLKSEPMEQGSEKKTVMVKLDSVNAIRALGGAVVAATPVGEEPPPASEVDDLKARMDAALKLVDELKAKLSGAEKKADEVTEAKAALETAHATELATKDAQIAAKAKDLEEIRASLEDLKKKPLVAQLLVNGAEAVIPGAEAGASNATPKTAKERALEESKSAYQRAAEQYFLQA